jgi:hypothetical protein
MSLGRFCPTVTASSAFHNNITAFISFLPYSKLHALVTIVTSAKDLCDLTIVTQECKQSQIIAEQG